MKKLKSEWSQELEEDLRKQQEYLSMQESVGRHKMCYECGGKLEEKNYKFNEEVCVRFCLECGECYVGIW